MSGNPGGGGGGSGGAGGGGVQIGPGAPINPCDLRFTTVLASINQFALPNLAVGQVLAIALETSGATVYVAAKDNAGALVGAIISHVAVLMGCIQQGRTYAADVVGINGSAVTVEVHPA